MDRWRRVELQIQLEDAARHEFRLSRSSSWSLFDELSKAISRAFGGAWVTKADGLDQRYWDLAVDDALVTLHLEHYLGVSIFPSESAVDAAASIRACAENLRVSSLAPGAPELGRIVKLFLEAVKEAVSMLQESGISLPESNVAWSMSSAPMGGTLLSGATYRRHGYGVSVRADTLFVDFDFGALGEINGFDAWRLPSSSNKIGSTAR